MKKHIVVLALGCLGAGLLGVACQSDLVPASELGSVRVLAVRTDAPYAAPGARVTAEALTFDGRPDAAGRTMQVSWLKDVCVAPKDDEVGDCYRRLGERYGQGQELDALVTQGAKSTFEVPADAISQSPPRRSPTQFATAFVFVAACAGRLRWIGTRAIYPDEVPVGCFDASGNQLGANDFVFAHARVFVYAERKNQNPDIERVHLDGVALATEAPLEIERCSKAKLEDCPERKLEIDISDGASEEDPSSGAPGLPAAREQVWASFFATRTKLKNEAVILFDARRGRLGKAENIIQGPLEPGDVDLFVVTHDNRSGVSWRKYQLRAR